MTLVGMAPDARVDPATKTPAAAARAFEHFSGGYIVGFYWSVVANILLALLCVALAGCVVFLVRRADRTAPLVIREFVPSGRVEITTAAEATFKADRAMIGFLLHRFAELHFARSSRTALADDYKHSLWFLAPAIRTQPVTEEDTLAAIDAYIATPSAPEIQIAPMQVTFLDLSTTGHGADEQVVGGRALVEFRQIYITPTRITDRTTRTVKLTVDFSLVPRVSPEMRVVNPLGLQIDHVIASQSVPE